METNNLIQSLAADLRRPALSFGAMWGLALAAAATIAAIVFFGRLGLRPDFATAVHSPRFLFKFVFTITLAVGAFRASLSLSRPEGTGVMSLAIAPLLLLGAVLIELSVTPPELWGARLIGRNSMVCLVYIPLIGSGPLAVFLFVLRHGAPTRPVLAGAMCGILAGAVSATFYAAQCTDDSPLFVVTWYTIAIAGLAAAGALGGKFALRW